MEDQAWKSDRVGSAQRGENPTVLARMDTSWAFIGDNQHLPGYCVLAYAHPGVDQLTDLPDPERLRFLADMVRLGDAVAAACRAQDEQFWRLNFAVLGNTWQHLHAHVIARYHWEPDEYRHGTVWQYPDRDHPRHALTDRHTPLRAAIAARLTDL